MRLVSTVRSPLKVYLPRKTKKDVAFILNLNTYRNTHYQILNQAKQIYKDIVASQILTLPVMQKVAVRFVLYPPTIRKMDTPNICSIHDKFFMDALVELGKLPGDDYDHYVETGYVFGKIDRVNPRVDIQLYDRGTVI